MLLEVGCVDIRVHVRRGRLIDGWRIGCGHSWGDDNITAVLGKAVLNDIERFCHSQKDGKLSEMA